MKAWEAPEDITPPAAVSFSVLADGKQTGNVGRAAAATDWTVVFSGLPKYDNGNIITYNVLENKVAGYLSDVSDNIDNKIIVTNTYNLKDITVEKVWDDKENKDKIRPASVEIILYANDEELDRLTLTQVLGSKVIISFSI